MSKNSLNNLMVITLSLFFIALLNGCSSDKELVSNFAAQEVKIDGTTSGWENTLQYLSDNNVAVGFKNDNKYLYVCLATNDLSKVFPMFRSGLIVWFESDKGETIGIKFPLHNTMDRESMPQPGERNDNDNQGEFLHRMLAQQNELEVVDEDKHLLTDMPAESKQGIEAKLGYNADRFIYELKVPLRNNNFAYQISALPGENIKVKFETEEPDKSEFQGRGMRQPDDGMGTERPGGGFGGERPRGERHRGMNNGSGSTEPLNFSVNVALTKVTKN